MVSCEGQKKERSSLEISLERSFEFFESCGLPHPLNAKKRQRTWKKFNIIYNKNNNYKRGSEGVSL